MTQRIDFYFDVGSPTAYLAWTQLPGIARETGAELVYRPILLGAVFRATGNASPMTTPAKATYMLRDLTRYARHYDVPLAFNPHFPVNTLLPMRVATAMQQHHPDRFPATLEALFTGMWVDALNLSDPDILRTRLIAHDIDADKALRLAGEEHIKHALKDATETAVQRGVFGAPTLFAGDEMFWGQDRLDMLRTHLLAGRE